MVEFDLEVLDGSFFSIRTLDDESNLVSNILATLLVIDWEEFVEEDWEFLFLHLRCWIKSAIVLMEEVAKKVNDANAACFREFHIHI